MKRTVHVRANSNDTFPDRSNPSQNKRCDPFLPSYTERKSDDNCDNSEIPLTFVWKGFRFTAGHIDKLLQSSGQDDGGNNPPDTAINSRLSCYQTSRVPAGGQSNRSTYKNCGTTPGWVASPSPRGVCCVQSEPESEDVPFSSESGNVSFQSQQM